MPNRFRNCIEHGDLENKATPEGTNLFTNFLLDAWGGIGGMSDGVDGNSKDGGVDGGCGGCGGCGDAVDVDAVDVDAVDVAVVDGSDG